MPIFRNKSLLIAIAVAISPIAVAAQVIDPLSPENAGLIRTKYEGSSNLPDGVSFYEILSFLDSLIPQERDVAIALIRGEMGLSDSGAKEFLDLMLAAFETLRGEIDDAEMALGCRNGVAATYGDSVYDTLEAMDDTRDEVAENRMNAVITSMSEDLGSRFHQWVDIQKLSISHVKFNHKESYVRTGKSADALLAAICGKSIPENRGVQE